MTLDKAIETLEDLTQAIDSPCGQPEIDAIKLGIEALKWRELMETDYGSWCGPPLPGETKD